MMEEEYKKRPSLVQVLTLTMELLIKSEDVEFNIKPILNEERKNN